nr:hypothetical protein [uncultured Rhodoferax sp.]
MADPSSLGAFLGGLGAGSIATAFLQHLLSRRAQRIDALRKDRSEVYAGLLQALEVIEVEYSVANAKRFGMWAARTEVIGSTEVISAVAAMRASSPDSPERAEAFSRLLRSMREDLHPA